MQGGKSEMSKRITMCIALTMMVVASTASAAISITQPFTGSDVTVSGQGAPGNAPVELWVNGESRGSVAADALARIMHKR
jgi:hypothetical protein